MALFWHKCLCKFMGPWKPVSGEGRARRRLSVIQNFKMSCRGQFNEKEFFFGEDEILRRLEQNRRAPQDNLNPMVKR